MANGGSGIIEKYKSSPYLFLKATYPEFKWEPWQFARLPKEAKADPDTIKAVLNHLAEGLLIKGSEEWERVSAIHVKQLGVKAFFRTHKDMISLAEKVFSSSSSFPRIPTLRSPCSFQVLATTDQVNALLSPMKF